MKKTLLDTIVDRMDYDGLNTIGKSIGSDSQTGVNQYQITASEMGEWMAFYYGIDPNATQPHNGIYQNGVYAAHGSQGLIGDDIDITRIYDLKNSTFYVQFDRICESDSAAQKILCKKKTPDDKIRDKTNGYGNRNTFG